MSYICILLVSFYLNSNFNWSSGELPLEDLLKLYNLERHSATPLSDSELMEEEEEEEEEDGSTSVSAMRDQEDEGSSEEEEEDTEMEEEPGLELLVSGKSLEEVLAVCGGRNVFVGSQE